MIAYDGGVCGWLLWNVWWHVVDVGGCQVWWSGFGRWARPVPTYVCIYIYISGWWFQTFFIFHNIWDNPSHWLSYFSEGLKPPTSIYTALLEGDQRPDHLGNMDLWINWIQSLWSCFFPTKIACLLSLQYCYLLKFVKLMLEFFKQPL